MIARLKKLLKTNKSLSLISSGTAAVLGLFTYGYLARSFSPSELGYWVLFMTVYTLFDMLRSGMISNAVIKKITEVDTEEEVAVVIGSGWKLSFWLTLVGSVLVALAFYIIYLFTDNDSYKLLFQWFVPISLMSLPAAMATWILNAYVKFSKIVWIRFLMQGGFFIGVLYHYYYGSGLVMVIMVYLISKFLPGFLATVKGWNKLKYVGRGTREMDKKIINFGKYSMGTLIGSNFLRSTDTFVIMFFLGSGAVAVYNVATKLVGLFEIPLRAFASIAFPQLSKKYAMGLKDEFRDEFETGSGFLTILLLPISIITFIFAEQMVVLLAGDEYLSSVNILRVFAVYTALTPLDKFCGIALDVINRPDLNFFKVMLMLTVNLVGDIIVLMVTDDIIWVAVVSIVTFASGIFFGFRFLKGHATLNIGIMLGKGISEYKRLIGKYVKGRS